MKKMILATAVAAACLASAAHAEDAPVVAAAPVPDNVIAYNVGVVNDYRFRGISQSRFDPALQGGIDYTNNPTGLYVGTWASTIKWIKDGVEATGKNGKGSVEIDLYAGKRGDIGATGFTYDVGGLYYYYPSNNYADSGNKNANTFELYAQVGYGPVYLKYSNSMTNAFGNIDSKNSGYTDLGGNFDVGYGTTLGLHIGHQTIKGNPGGVSNSQYSYTDWKIGVSKTFEELYGVTLGLAYVGSDAKDASYSGNPNKKNQGRNGLVVSLLKTF